MTLHDFAGLKATNSTASQNLFINSKEWENPTMSYRSNVKSEEGISIRMQLLLCGLWKKELTLNLSSLHGDFLMCL